MTQSPQPGEILTSESVKLLKAGDVVRQKDWNTICTVDDVSDQGAHVGVTLDGKYSCWPATAFTFIGRPDQDGWIHAPEGGWTENPVPGCRVDVAYGGPPFKSYFAGYGDLADWTGEKDDVPSAFRLAAPSVERDLGPSAGADTHRATDDPVVAWVCKKCNSPRPGTTSCWKCGGALKKPADGWEWPETPDVARVRALAREVGYGLGVHGSMERDLDLIAIPWVAEAVPPLALAQHIAAGLEGRVMAYETQDKPAGRWSCNIAPDGWFKMIDLSVMPPTTAAETGAVGMSEANEPSKDEIIQRQGEDNERLRDRDEEIIAKATMLVRAFVSGIKSQRPGPKAEVDAWGDNVVKQFETSLRDMTRARQGGQS